MAALGVASEEGITKPPVDISPEDTHFYFIFPIQKAFKVWVASIEGPCLRLLCGSHVPSRLQPLENPGALLLPLPKVWLTTSFHGTQQVGASWCKTPMVGCLWALAVANDGVSVLGEPMLSSTPVQLPRLSLSLWLGNCLCGKEGRQRLFLLAVFLRVNVCERNVGRGGVWEASDRRASSRPDLGFG